LHALKDQLLRHERHVTCLFACLLLDERLSQRLERNGRQAICMLRVKCNMADLT